MIKVINYFVQSILIYLFFIFGRILGLNLARNFFSYLFEKIGPIFKSKKIILDNLQKISNFKKVDNDKIISSMWKNYGMTFIEYIFLDIFVKNSNHIEIIGKTNLNKIIEINKPVIFVSGHFANYELMSMEITKKKIKLATIYRPLNNFFLNPFMEFLRKKFVCKNQIRKGLNGVRDSIKFIKKGYSVALMIDQRVSEGEKIDFFGDPAFTTTLPAQLAIKHNLFIVPVFIERIDKKKFKIEFKDFVDPSKYNNKIQLSKKLNQILEQMIINNPNQWIWTHNRWK
tara:strand:+ start:7996 stop:8850 length:855 start_codon:yes stop_codon:yes gene_type:complete